MRGRRWRRGLHLEGYFTVLERVYSAETHSQLTIPSQQRVVPEQANAGLLTKIFTDSMLPLYIAVMGLSFLFFLFFGALAPLFFAGISLLVALLAGQLVARSGTWEITETKPEIQLLQIHLPSGTPIETFSKKAPAIRRALYDATIAAGKPIDCDTAGQIFAAYGIACSPEDLFVKTVNLFRLVRKAASRFHLATPRIVVTNSTVPNAAAAGPNTRLGVILITTGILTQLENDELLSVIGHEFSHLKAHDPLILLALSTAEYLLRFYVFWPFLFSLGFVSYWIYFTVAIGSIYFFGKFLEGRADLDTAKIIGHPRAMATALRKIAFRHLFPLDKREATYREVRRSEWLLFDPHPPAQFRIARLERIDDPAKIRNTFLESVKDTFSELTQK
jgi:heat shock protein HtpX